MAQEAEMSLTDYREFVYDAGLLNDPDPVAAWQKELARQRELIAWLNGKNRVILKGANIDLKLSIKNRTFMESDGKYNFPDGEIFTGPLEHSVNGWVRFRYPAIYDGQEVTDIELWLKTAKSSKKKPARDKSC